MEQYKLKTDFERDNDHQTCQHTMLFKTAAVRYLVVRIKQYSPEQVLS